MSIHGVPDPSPSGQLLGSTPIGTTVSTVPLPEPPSAWMNHANLISCAIDRKRYPLGHGDQYTARGYKSDYHDIPLYTAAQIHAHADQVESAAIKPYRDAIDDELSTMGSCMLAGESPRDAIKRAIDWAVQVALDPVVSSDAASLVAAARADAFERCAKVCDDEAAYRESRQEKPEHWDIPHAQGHKAITARTLAAAIRSLGQKQEQG